MDDGTNLALMLLRAQLGLVMVAHGWNHLFGGGKLDGTARWFESIGMRPGRLHAWSASVTELVSGVLLLLGFLTPLAAAGVVGVMVVAWVTAHLGNGFFIFRPGQGWEYVMTLAVVAVAVAGLGPGDWSLDARLSVGDDLTGMTGVALSSALGVGSAAFVLTAFWRPARGERSAGG